MSKYLIKIKCDKQGLAEILASAIDSKANIEIDYETISETPVIQQQPLLAPAVSLQDQRDAQPKSTKAYQQKLLSWTVYKMLVDNYPSGLVFKSSDVYHLQKRLGYDGTINAVSAHLSRMSQVGLINRTGGNVREGYKFELTKPVNHKEFVRLISNYNNKAKIKEHQRTLDRNKWINLGKLQSAIRN